MVIEKVCEEAGKTQILGRSEAREGKKARGDSSDVGLRCRDSRRLF